MSKANILNSFIRNSFEHKLVRTGKTDILQRYVIPMKSFSERLAEAKEVAERIGWNNFERELTYCEKHSMQYVIIGGKLICRECRNQFEWLKRSHEKKSKN
jgi:hypothetical protein